jgi:hypothetical protein
MAAAINCSGRMLAATEYCAKTWVLSPGRRKIISNNVRIVKEKNLSETAQPVSRAFKRCYDISP